MSTPLLDPDDPRLTAYALGESDADERLTVEALLAASPAARAAVEQTRGLARELEEDFARENATYQQEHPPTVVPANVVPFPAPGAPRRWRPVVAATWKLAALLLVLASLVLLINRRTAPPVSVATIRPSAPPAAALPEPRREAAPPVPPPAPETPADANQLLAAAPVPAAKDEAEVVEDPRRRMAADTTAQAPARRAAAEAPPGAARPAPPAAAPAAGAAPSMEERLISAIVRLRLKDGTFVGGVLLSADGILLGARRLPSTDKPARVTAVLSDQREFTAVPGDADGVAPGRLRIAASSLAHVPLADRLPRDGSQLTVVRVDESTGALSTTRVRAKRSGDTAYIEGVAGRADFVFTATGELLAVESLPYAASKASARDSMAADRSAGASLLVHPFTATERAALTRPPP